MEENTVEPRFLDINFVWSQDIISDIILILNYYVILPLDKEEIYMLIKHKRASLMAQGKESAYKAGDASPWDSPWVR